MKGNKKGFLLIEALVYVALLIFASFLACTILTSISTANRTLVQNITRMCQVHSAMVLLRNDLAQAPHDRTCYRQLAPNSLLYTLQEQTIQWNFANHRLTRTHKYRRGTQYINDHAVVLEGIDSCIFTPRMRGDFVYAFTVDLSHNAKHLTHTIYSRSLL